MQRYRQYFPDISETVLYESEGYMQPIQPVSQLDYSRIHHCYNSTSIKVSSTVLCIQDYIQSRVHCAPTQSLWSLSEKQRRDLFRAIIDWHVAIRVRQCLILHQQIESITAYIHHLKAYQKQQILSRNCIIGLTTTGCALNQHHLRSIKPKLILVEEAAQILESQVLACLTTSLTQIVLIGDHYQLQPFVDNYQLQRHNKMHISLFERLSRTIQPIRLIEQRRMSPSISRLIKCFYMETGEIVDHSTTYSRQMTHEACFNGCACPGLQKDVFMWSHCDPEKMFGNSVVNPREATMAIGLSIHLIQQGVPPSSISIITPYLGQSRLISRLLNDVFTSQPGLEPSQRKQLVVSTIDQFQGNENDVIILSIARSAKLTEFIKLRNRFIVACSRARFSFIIIGSTHLLNQSAHWKQLIQTLKNDNAVSEHLPITRKILSNGTVEFELLSIHYKEANLLYQS